MPARSAPRALAALLTLSVCSIGAAAPALNILPVAAYSDVIAAEMCLHHGYPWMLRLGRDDVLCLSSAVGAGDGAVRTQDVIDAAVRQVRGQ